jgi:hypothetical protein
MIEVCAASATHHKEPDTMHYTIQRADGLYYKGDSIYNPWTADAALATQIADRAEASATARELRSAAKRAGAPQEITLRASALELAQAFSRELRAELTADEIAQVIALNATETSPDVCHSHDFCDANMTMLRALGGLLGLRPERVQAQKYPHLLDLMGTAQDIAFNHRFFTAE